MKLFKSKAKPQPIVQPEPETVKAVEKTYICAACGHEGAMYPLGYPVSCFGYISLDHIMLCKECDDKRIVAQLNHSFKQRKEWPDTQVRLMAIDKKMKAREA